MEKRDLYLIIVIVVVFVIAISAYSLTGKVSLGSCSDSDNGLNYETKGTAKYENRDTLYTDVCLSDLYLKEYYCYTDITIRSEKHQCPNGCVNGVCVK